VSRGASFDSTDELVAVIKAVLTPIQARWLKAWRQFSGRTQ
jgi:hypothetical protein